MLLDTSHTKPPKMTPLHCNPPMCRPQPGAVAVPGIVRHNTQLLQEPPPSPRRQQLQSKPTRTEFQPTTTQGRAGTTDVASKRALMFTMAPMSRRILGGRTRDASRRRTDDPDPDTRSVPEQPHSSLEGSRDPPRLSEEFLISATLVEDEENRTTNRRHPVRDSHPSEGGSDTCLSEHGATTTTTTTTMMVVEAQPLDEDEQLRQRTRVRLLTGVSLCMLVAVVVAIIIIVVILLGNRNDTSKSRKEDPLTPDPDPTFSPSVLPTTSPSLQPTSWTLQPISTGQPTGLPSHVPDTVAPPAPSTSACLHEAVCLRADAVCGNCREAHLGLGCVCAECECVVCERDPFCCANEWDSICVDLALELCDCKAVPTASPTIVPTDRPTASVSPTFSLAPTTVPTTSLQPSSNPTDRTKSDMELMLAANYAILGGAEFSNNEESYTMQALRFVERTSLGMPNWRIGQRYALASIYYATMAHVTESDNSNGSFNSLAAGSRPALWTVGRYPQNECHWFGITCTKDLTDDEGLTYGNVTDISLYQSFLTGVFPREVTILQDSLKLLNLHGNNALTNDGWANVWWLGDLTMLQELDLTKTGFSYKDGIPTEFGHLRNLVRLSLYATQFTGPLNDTVFETMTSLQEIDLALCSFSSSPLPLSMKHLPELQVVDLSYSDFAGSLDDFWDGTGFPKLRAVRLAGNVQLGGTLPTTVGLLSDLGTLDVSNCGLTGTIPTELEHVSNLQTLRLNDNQFQDTIPFSLGNLTALETLYLQGNYVSGTMPPSICENRVHGKLKFLGADCTEGKGQPADVTCDTTICCTCCGSCCTGGC